MIDPRDVVITEARRRALAHLRTVESNVIQDRLVIECINVALDYTRRFIVVPDAPAPKPEPWYQKLWDFFAK